MGPWGLRANGSPGPPPPATRHPSVVRPTQRLARTGSRAQQRIDRHARQGYCPQPGQGTSYSHQVRRAGAVWADRRGVIGWALTVSVVVGFGSWAFLQAWAKSAGPLPVLAEEIRRLLVAAGPFALAALAVYQVADALTERRQKVPENWLSTADLIRREIEKTLMRLDAPGEVSRCTLKVWMVSRAKKTDSGPQQRLMKVWADSRTPAPASNVDWEVGKGVIGQAVSQRRGLARNVASTWRDVWDCDETAWTSLDSDRTFGVTFEEFLRLRGDQPEDSPFVMAVPVRRKGKVVGVAALDAPSYMETIIVTAGHDILRYLAVLGTDVLDGDDRGGSVGAHRHHATSI